MYFFGPLLTVDLRWGAQLEPIYNSSVLIQDVAVKTFRDRRTVGTSGGRGSGKSVPAARYDDDDSHLTLIILFDINHSFAQLMVSGIQDTANSILY